MSFGGSSRGGVDALMDEAIYSRNHTRNGLADMFNLFSRGSRSIIVNFFIGVVGSVWWPRYVIYTSLFVVRGSRVG